MRVLCTRPNAAELISGVRFTQTDDGLLSEEISEAQAALFLAIKGYRAVETAVEPEKPRRGRPPKHEVLSDDQ